MSTGPSNPLSINDGESEPLLPEVGEESQRQVPSTNSRGPQEHSALRRTQSEIIRRPVQYHSINSEAEYDDDTRASLTRYRYYGRLAPFCGSELVMPDHVVPAAFYSVLASLSPEGQQSSFVTIFAIWNTMMGTSLLSMPWAIQQAGFGLGLGLMLVMAGLTLYTAYRVMTSIGPLKAGEVQEFSDVCRRWLGRWGEVLSVVFSGIALVGALAVYWVLMSNFLYHTVTFVYSHVHPEDSANSSYTGTTIHGGICPRPPIMPPHNNSSHNSSSPSWAVGASDQSVTNPVFNRWWHQYNTVPLYLAVLVAPLINFKSPTFFTKFNVLGTVSVAYLTFFTIYKGTQWGFNMDFKATDVSTHHVPLVSGTFPALTGTLSLAFFIHNCVLSITRNAAKPTNNARDLTIAYCLVCLTYVFVGAFFYSTFPFHKSCIEDNLLNNFVSTDVLAFVARLGLFFQMYTVLPLIFYILRLQFMHTVFKSVYPSLLHVLVLNAVLVTVCILIARFLPTIGTIIRFSGATCGLAYIFALPCLIFLLKERAAGRLTSLKTAFHALLIVLGVANFGAQFTILKM